MKSSAARTQVVPAQLPLPNQPGDKAISWPSTEFSAIHGVWRRKDRSAFPSEEHIETRRREASSTPSRVGDAALCSVDFVKAAHDAQLRIWILDPKFSTDDEGILEIIAEHTEATDIRILSEAHDEAERRKINGVASFIQDSANGRAPPPLRTISVRWLPRMDKDVFPFLHDRFAIVDDELWHFGATVGGGHKSLNAFTRGWHARDTGAIEFYNHLWTRFGG